MRRFDLSTSAPGRALLLIALIGLAVRHWLVGGPTEPRPFDDDAEMWL